MGYMLTESACTGMSVAEGIGPISSLHLFELMCNVELTQSTPVWVPEAAANQLIILFPVPGKVDWDPEFGSTI